MAETITVGDRRLLAWDVRKDVSRWLTVLGEHGGAAATAMLSFAGEIYTNLTAFIAELRPGNEQQLLRAYAYDLSHIDDVMQRGEGHVVGIEHAYDRAHAMTRGIDTAHRHYRRHGGGAQAILMSPVSETADEPEFQYTAIYWQTFRNGRGEAWQLFLDLNHEERHAFMAWMAGRNGKAYDYHHDLDLAANPVLLDKKKYLSIEAFLSDIAVFLGHRGIDTAVARRIRQDPSRFVQEQRALEQENMDEARGWVDGYVRAIAQGSIELGKRILTQLQMKILGVTESMVRTAARSVRLDAVALHTFLRACGFLEFTFATEVGMSSLLFGAEALVTGGDRVKCPVCSSRAKHDVYVHCPVGQSCPGCGNRRECG